MDTDLAQPRLDNAAILAGLNAPQQQAVAAQATHLRVIAGAGSGKTRVLVHRIAWLVLNKQLAADSVLAVTFTNKAAAEMRKRIQTLLGAAARTMWIGTFHGITHRIMREHALAMGLPRNFQILDSDDQLRIIKRIIRGLEFDEEQVEPKRAQHFINRHKDEGRRYAHLSHDVPPEQTYFMQVYERYERHCQRGGLVDFAELLLGVYELWQQRPDILQGFQQRFAHVLVDEFQDTNAIQYKWLRALCGPQTHITVVGDDDQSIYGWRGAKVENIHGFAQEFPESLTIRLEQNYRSTNAILAAANALIQHNEARLGKQLWTEGVKGELLSLYGGFNELDEARFIVDRTRKWLQQGGALNDVGILYRSNAQSRAIEQSLRQANLAYKVYGGLRFFDRAEIKDVMAYLKLLVNQHDDTALERVINVPPRGIGERTLLQIREHAKSAQLSLWQAAQQISTGMTGKAGRGLVQFFALIERLMAQLPSITLPQLTQQVIQDSGLLAYLKTQPGEKTYARIENLNELTSAVTQFVENLGSLTEVSSQYADKNLPHFLAEIALDAGERDVQDNQCIKLMTLHSAKGLEFPLVFLAGLEEGLFPHHRSLNTKELLEEERRLCYVGLTRAMRKLYLSYAEKRAFSGNVGINRPSRFIEEIPNALLEKLNTNNTVRPALSAPVKSSSSMFKQAKHLGSEFPFKMGQTVMHPRFGEGVVIGGEGSGQMARVQVRFAQTGEKWLALAYAKLTAL
jgi:DNA helicase-2/ATP-dependent DNA helicase PcrA